MSYWAGVSNRPPNTFQGRTYAAAKEYLDGGLNPKNRRVGKTSYLAMQPDDSISLVLHRTSVVTYMPDGTFILDHGGFRTVTTQTWINTFSPFYVGSTHDRKNKGWTVGDTDELTPPRVQKCRTCSGTGWDPWCMAQSRKTPGGWPNSKMTKCYRCDGAKVVDYGSRPIPIMFEWPIQLAEGAEWRKPIVIDDHVIRHYPPEYEPYERWRPTYVISGYSNSMLKAMA